MSIDGFRQLSEANSNASKAQAEIATMMADIPNKLATANLTNQKAIRQHLDNVAKAYDIEWDMQAQRQLKRMIAISLRKAVLIESERILLNKRAAEVGRLLEFNPTFDGVRAGWIAFNYLTRVAGTTAQILAMRVATKEFKLADCSGWQHAGEREDILVPGGEVKYIGNILHWAQTNNMYPTQGGPPWEFIACYLENLSMAVSAKAVEINARVDAARSSALELCKIDWDRLKESNEMIDKNNG